ncbi:MAG: hypothetical protein ACYS83_04545, partial [Planctomycetota bacterium]
MAVNRMVRPVGLRPAGATAALTPKEVFGILRRHVLLMISMTMLGLIIGGAAWYLLLSYAPKYTARTFLRVLPPVEKDPMVITAPQVAKDIQYGYRVSIAALIMEQRTLQELIDLDKIRATKWFKRFAKFDEQGSIINTSQCIRKAFRDLKKHFMAYAQRDGQFVTVSMTCGDAKESADIVNTMVDMFRYSYGSAKKREVAVKLARLRDEHDSVQRELQAAEDSLGDVRRASGLTDLADTGGRR